MIGNLPDQWVSVRLGACLKRRRETVLPATIDADFLNVVGLEDIEDRGRGGIVIKKMRPADAESLKTRFYSGDILYGKLRPYLNKVGIAPDDGLCSTEIWAFGAEDFVDPFFVYAFLSSPFFVERVSGMTKGANLPRLDIDTFEAIEIPVPALSEQRRIVDIVRSVERIWHLRSLASGKAWDILPAAFTSMFGDLADGRSRWPLLKVSDFVAALVAGKSLPDAGNEIRGGLRVLKISAVTSGRFDPKESKPVPPGHTPALDHFVKKDDLLISRANTAELVGATALVEHCPANLLLPDKLWRFVWKDTANTSPEFMSVLFRMPSVRHKISAAATGTGGSMKNISMRKLMSLQLSIPPPELQLAFGRIYREMRSVNNLSRDEAVASALNDSLLSTTFTGKLTAKWRQRNVRRLEDEIEFRDRALGAAGATILVGDTGSSDVTLHVGWDQGACTDLTRDQCTMLGAILESVRKAVEDKTLELASGNTFTAAQVADSLTGPLHNNIHAVEANLAVLAARGLVVALSRGQRAPDTDQAIYGNCYRLAGGAPGGDRPEDGASRLGGVGLRDQEVLRLLGPERGPEP